MTMGIHPDDHLCGKMGDRHIPSTALDPSRIVHNPYSQKFISLFSGKLLHDLLCPVFRTAVDQKNFHPVMRICLPFNILQKSRQTLLFIVSHNTK